MNSKTDNTINYIEGFLSGEYESLKKNLESLLKDYKRKTVRLDKIMKQSDKQQLTMMKLNEELNLYKNHLEEKVEQEIQIRQEKEKMLLQQSKLAAMGEMMDAVAHQWKQPINIINLQADMIKYDFDDGLVDKDYIDKFQSKIVSQVDHMDNTLNEFRSFFRPNKQIEEFNVEKMIEKVLLLVKDEFLQHNIVFKLTAKQNFSLLGIENEFKHLILNIINNSKDAFIENETKNRVIDITIFEFDGIKTIEIADNAGGIPEEIIQDIFKANLTTKAEGKGTGIGLYMSSQIATKYNGDLSVVNGNDGAKFIFKYLEENVNA